MIKVQSHHLQPGDIVGSKETVIGVSSGLGTPKGKVEVTLEKRGSYRTALWGKYTLINVERKAVK
jgi:hypothetical protein